MLATVSVAAPVPLAPLRIGVTHLPAKADVPAARVYTEDGFDLDLAAELDANRKAGATILHRVTYHPSVANTEAAIARTAFLPTLSDRKLAGIDRQKRFLLEHGYIARDFDSRSWADSSYLEEALATA
ncbi:hypothetical protein [Ancylobacter terrae]|uniref:hypothetical protein n=1 Tax=Ancylobacter sp. sgz301288 TaxID=3342077 RepID=UPI00385E16C0